MPIDTHLARLRSLILHWSSADPDERLATEALLKAERDLLGRAVDRVLAPHPQAVQAVPLPPIAPGSLMGNYARLLRSQWAYGGHLWHWTRTAQSDLRTITLDSPQGRLMLVAPTLDPAFQASIRAYWKDLLPTVTPPRETWVYGPPRPRAEPSDLICLGQHGDPRTEQREAQWQASGGLPLQHLKGGRFVTLS